MQFTNFIPKAKVLDLFSQRCYFISSRFISVKGIREHVKKLIEKSRQWHKSYKILRRGGRRGWGNQSFNDFLACAIRKVVWLFWKPHSNSGWKISRVLKHILNSSSEFLLIHIQLWIKSSKNSKQKLGNPYKKIHSLLNCPLSHPPPLLTIVPPFNRKLD